MTRPTREEVPERVAARDLEVKEVGPAVVLTKPVVETDARGRRRWHVMSLIGRWQFVLLATAAAAALAWRAGRRREAIDLVGGVAVAAVAANFVLKPLVKDPRPAGHDAAIEFGYGFPSGHAAAAIAFGTLAPRAVLGRGRARGGATLAGLAFAAAMGLARVRVTAHDWEDVLGGWMLGALAAGAAARGIAASPQ